MKVTLDSSKTFLVFLPENAGDGKAITSFPGLTRRGSFFTCPMILPVAFNLIQRLKNLKVKVGHSFHKVQFSYTPEIKEWLDQPFQLKPIPESFKYHTQPKKFQEIALRYIYTTGTAGILLDPGMGKSKVILDYIHLMEFLKVLIVCPKPLMFVWEDEILKHRPELSNFYCVKTTDWEQEKDAIAAARVVIINYDKAVGFEEQLQKVGFDFMHLDEFLIKNHKTSRTKAMISIGRYVKYRAGGSGTLINNAPTECYGPLKFLERSLVGDNYATFFGHYTVQLEVKKPGGEKTGLKQVVGFKNQKELRSMLESCCIVMTKEQWLELPEKHFHDIWVQMGQDQKEAYYSLLRNYYAKVGEYHIEADNPLVMMSKLYQISNGFLYINDESEAEALDELFPGEKEVKRKKKREVYYFKDNPKIKALNELIEEKLTGRRAIIWFNLEAEGKMIEEALKSRGDTYHMIKGGEKNVGEKVRDFNKNQNVRWLVCQAKSVNYGITVLGSKAKDLEELGETLIPDVDTQVYTQIFYSLNFSLEVYLQQQDRIHRLGQDRACEYYRLFSNSPVERKIREALIEKTAIREEMLVDVAKTLLANKDESITEL